MVKKEGKTAPMVQGAPLFANDLPMHDGVHVNGSVHEPTRLMDEHGIGTLGEIDGNEGPIEDRLATVEVGDSVSYYLGDEGRKITITITHRTHDPDNGLLTKNHPLVTQIMGAELGETLEVHVANARKKLVVAEIVKGVT
jgi:hypothetical protein